jgi:hypothetical protein
MLSMTATAIALLLITGLEADAASVQHGPLSCSDIDFLLERKVSSKRIMELLAERQNGCRANKETLDVFKKAGADENLVAAIERGGVAPAEKPTKVPQLESKESPKTIQDKPPKVETLNVQAWANKSTYSEGENIIINIRMDRTAYVRVYYMDASGQTYRIYPNASHPEASIPAGTVLTVPSANDNFQIPVFSPFGAGLISVLASEKSFNYLNERGAQAGAFFLASGVPAVGNDVVKRQVSITTRTGAK